jgi:hypothetical protein
MKRKLKFSVQRYSINIVKRRNHRYLWKKLTQLLKGMF